MTGEKDESRTSIKPFYFGSGILYIVSCYAEMREKEFIFTIPIISLEISTDANLYCVGNEFYTRFLLRHAIEVGIQSSRTLVLPFFFLFIFSIY